MKIYRYRSNVSFPAGAGRRLSVDGRELEEAENGQQFVSLEDYRKAVEEAVEKEREACAKRLEWHAAQAAGHGFHSDRELLEQIADDLRSHNTRQDAEPQEASPDREA